MPRPRTVEDSVVLDAAADAIGRLGPARLTLADVAAAAGLSPATLVQRFGSKRGLLLAVSRRPLDWEAVTRAAREAEPTRLGTLVAALVALTASVREPEAMANHLAFLQLDLSDPDFHALALAHFVAMQRWVEGLLHEAGTAGELDGAEARALAGTVVTTYNGALITWAVLRDGALEAFLRRQLDAVLAPYATRRPVSATE